MREEGDLDLSSLAPRELMAAKGVIVEEIEEGVNEEAAAPLLHRPRAGGDELVVRAGLRQPQ